MSGTVAVSSLWAFVWWYFTPLLPFVAAVSAVWVAELRPRWLSRAVAGACVGIAAFNFAVVSWGAGPWSRPLAQALGAPIGSETCRLRRAAAFCPGPPRSGRWPADEILRAVVEDRPECADGRTECRVFLVIRGIRDALFIYSAARDWPGARFEFPSYEREDCQLQALLESDYVFHQAAVGGRRCFGSWHRLLEAPPEAFRRAHRLAASFELPAGEGGVLLARRAAPTPEEEAALRAAWARKADPAYRHLAKP